MELLIIAGALLLNILTARLFKPYPQWVVRSHAGAANYFAGKKYRTCVRMGGVAAILTAGLIWAVVDIGGRLLSEQSDIYGYIITGITVYFGIACGQTAGILTKYIKHHQNGVYTRQLLGYLLAENSEHLENNRLRKVFTSTLVRVMAERIVMPAILYFILGNGSVWAYLFINTFAWSDNHTEIKAHGYQAIAIKLNRIISAPGYAALSLLLWIVKWIFGLRFSFKDGTFKSRCLKQTDKLCGSDNDDENYIRGMRVTVYACCVLMLPLLLSVYMFIQTTMAAIGLDAYWDFWSGKNIGK